MGRTREFNIEEAIKAATRLFWRGYDKTSLIDLTEALGIGAASFYFAFGSKEALFRQVVDRYIASLDLAFERAFKNATTAGAVESLLHDYADVVTGPDHTPGCLVVNNSPSMSSEDALQQWLAGHRETLWLRLRDRFSTAVANGKLADDSNPTAMARFVATLAGGIAVEAQSGASRQDLHAMIDFALKDFAGRRAATA